MHVILLLCPMTSVLMKKPDEKLSKLNFELTRISFWNVSDFSHFQFMRFISYQICLKFLSSIQIDWIIVVFCSYLFKPMFITWISSVNPSIEFLFIEQFLILSSKLIHRFFFGLCSNRYEYHHTLIWKR